MKVGIGSKNSTKVNAVLEVLRDYPMFSGAEIEGVEVQIEQFGHPKNLDEIVSGAIERAKQAQAGRDYGFGIESGLMAVPHTKTGHMEIAFCAIYDGERVALGTAPGYEWPHAVLDGILNKGLDGSQAIRAAGLTELEKIGAHGGFVSIFTDGRLNRTDYNKPAIVMALMQLEHPEHY